MKIPNGLPGSKTWELQELQKRKLQEALDLEERMEKELITESNQHCSITLTGKPTCTRIELKKDCSPKELIVTLNKALERVHTFRDGLAKELFERG